MKMGQHMKLAPRMIQSMEILQMPLAELEERIERELENNPTLEISEPTALDPLDTAPEVSGRSLSDRIDQFSNTHHRQQNSGERDAKMDAMAQAPARSESLTEQLLHQWMLVDVEPRMRELGDVLISNLDADGFLRTPLETIAERINSTPPTTILELERALGAVQLFLEPQGVAARDVRECLLLQLAALPEREEPPDPLVTERARRLIADHLDDLMKNRLPKVSERTGYTLEEIKGALELMRTLSLAPAKRLINDAPTAIAPDAVVEYEPDSDRYIAYLNDTRLPNLRVNQEYARLARDKTMPQRDREFIRTNMGNAQWLLDAVNQRRGTLLKVVEAVVGAQREFFDFGPQALKPLPMSQIADEIGVHVATVSRAVADKYIATPRGVLPLRKFFSGGLSTKPDADGDNEGEELAWEAVKIALREVIDKEAKSKPLSDDALAEELKKRGIDIARRTVAKYRDQLQIPPARLRKTF